MTQEISEVSVEINEIFNNMSIDLLNKIPLNVRDFFKNNASNTYTFEYDTTKSLNEQNIKTIVSVNVWSIKLRRELSFA